MKAERGYRVSLFISVSKILTITVLSLLLAACERKPEVSAARAQPPNLEKTLTNASSPSGSKGWHWNQAKADELLNRANRPDNPRALEDAVEYAKMMGEKLEHEPLSNEVPLPNFASGPGLPRPLGINFYEQYDSYPGFLLCIHDVSETHYEQSNEPEWFKAALLQIRGAGKGRFPPIRRIAILIQNRYEWTNSGSFEHSFKAGAIFSADDVFQLAQSASNLVAHAKVDRHPLHYDPQQSSESSRKRWTIVEQDQTAR